MQEIYSQMQELYPDFEIPHPSNINARDSQNKVRLGPRIIP